MSTRLRIGILGAAKIAGPFMAGARQSTRVEVTAVASREPARAEAFARQHGIARACSYDELVAAAEVDAVYVALPNHVHARWSMAAARAGKHVLCEKPLATSEAEAREMFAAARESGVVLLEAFPYFFQPQTLEIERLITSGTIGQVRTMYAAFGFTVSDPDNIRLDPALAGGALMDAGCYAVSFARLVFGSRPVRVGAVARWQGGVDRTLAGTLEYAGGGIAQVSCSFATGLHRRAIIAGSAGVIDTEYHNHTNRHDSPTFRLRLGSDWQSDFQTIPVPREDGFRLEVDAFAEMTIGGWGTTLEARTAASLDNAWTLAALLESARSQPH
jgi:D-xylose 1-dehydrogenase (NADP+, D-xylono-1,5-lactone-forming)